MYNKKLYIVTRKVVNLPLEAETLFCFEIRASHIFTYFFNQGRKIILINKEARHFYTGIVISK